jgi:hypothetical protein
MAGCDGEIFNKINDLMGVWVGRGGSLQNWQSIFFLPDAARFSIVFFKTQQRTSTISFQGL